jgi:iron complex transport system substrate-binding protein
MYPPERIVCLTEETTETLYLLGEQHRIVGISGYTVRHRRRARRSTRVSADIPKILALEPDLVLTFSDLQAELVAALIRAGISVHAFNQRTVAGILEMIRTLGALVGATDRANALTERLAANLESTRRRTANHGKHPKVYFEEWDEPMISGIGWVSELIAICRRRRHLSRVRRVQVREGSDRHAKSSGRSRA